MPYCGWFLVYSDTPYGMSSTNVRISNVVMPVELCLYLSLNCMMENVLHNIFYGGYHHVSPLASLDHLQTCNKAHRGLP